MARTPFFMYQTLLLLIALVVNDINIQIGSRENDAHFHDYCHKGSISKTLVNV